MGAAVSVFGRADPNIEALKALVTRLDVVRAERPGLSYVQLYHELEKELNDFAQGRSSISPNPNPNPSVVPPARNTVLGAQDGICILVVDDSSISCKLVKRCLTNIHCNVTLCESGEHALALLVQHPSLFDLVLLDIVMPGMDGVQVLTRIKASSIINRVPVAMLSGVEDQTLADMCLQQGAVEVLLKPLKVDAVTRVIEKYCHKPASTLAGSDGLNPNVAGTLRVGAALGLDSISLCDSAFQPVNVLNISQGKKILLVFFPAAFAHGENYRCDQLLTQINSQIRNITSRNTDIYGVGHEIPYTLQGLKRSLDLQFQLLSDPSLTISSHCVGTMDFGAFMANSTGIVTAGLQGYHTSNAGLVLLSENRTVIYKYVCVGSDGTPDMTLVPDVQDLFRQLESNQEGKSERTSTRTSSRISVLVVDDSNISSKLAVRKLASLGHDAAHAENGLVAFEILKRSPHAFDVVLLDIVMPVMDGVELLNMVKSNQMLSHIPIVMLSGLEDETLASMCLDSGAADVLPKPLDVDKVQALFRKLNIGCSEHS